MDNNHIKQVADTIYRMNKKVAALISKENAGKDALKSIYEGRGADILAIEMEKAGDLKTLSNRINERLDLIHTHVLRVCEDMGIKHPFRAFTDADLSSETITKAKSTAQLKKARTDAQKAVLKAFSDLIGSIFEADLTKLLISAIKEAYEVAKDRKYEVTDLGNIKRKYTSDFVD